MNYLLIVVLVILVWSVLSGFRKGFLRTVFDLISWVLILVICNVVTPEISDYMIEQTMVDETISDVIVTKLNEMIATSDVAQIEQSIPEEIRVALLGEGGSIQNILLAEGEEMIAASSIVQTIVGVLAFVVVAIGTWVLMKIVGLFLKIASKLPVIGTADKLLGVLCGGAKGLLVCWVLLAVVSLLALTGTNTEWASFITQSQFLTWMQENNLILNMLVAGQTV